MKQEKQFDPFSNLGEQIVNIAKAGAYDAISPRLGELQEENKALKAANKELREALELAIKRFKLLYKKDKSFVAEMAIESAQEVLRNTNSSNVS